MSAGLHDSPLPIAEAWVLLRGVCRNVALRESDRGNLAVEMAVADPETENLEPGSYVALYRCDDGSPVGALPRHADG